MAALSLNTLIALKAADAAVKACTYVAENGENEVDFGELVAKHPDAIRFIVCELAGEGADNKPLTEVIDYVVGNLDTIMQRFASEMGDELIPRLQKLASTLVTVVGTAREELGAAADKADSGANGAAPDQADTASGA
ncbi:MAG: hypothetical protein NXI11_00810 [Proteobacteria bacterium]|nr:hypothetical protein [Pseudomonadota bacterium]